LHHTYSQLAVGTTSFVFLKCAVGDATTSIALQKNN